MTVRPRGLPAWVPVHPSVLIAAVRGAVSRYDGESLEVARAVRDHRDDLSDEVVSVLLQVIATSPPPYRSQWLPALRELRRPSLTERARTRAAKFERTSP